MIHVCFGLYDKTGRYSKFTGTAMLSLFDNIIAPPYSITIHILHDNTLTPDNHDKFIYVAGQYNQLVKFYNVEELCAEKIKEFWQRIPAIRTSWSTIGSFYRLLIPKILSSDIDKCIYLDSDIIINLDINELWQINLGNNALAAVPEMEANAYNYEVMDAAKKYLLIADFVNYEDYFNAGLLLMNLNYFRFSQNLIMNGIEFYGEHPQCNAFDQDILNYLFSKNYLRLPDKFDSFICNERSQGRTQIQKKIYHFSTPTLGLSGNDPFNQLWMRYFMKTPWFDEETIGRLYDGFEQMYNELKSSVINFSAMMSGKKRAFFTTPENIEATKGIFSVRDDEEIILIENQKSLQKLIDAMKRSKGKKIFFILYPYFPFNALIQEGFVYGRDFLNGLEFLSPEHGVPLNSYPLILAM